MQKNQKKQVQKPKAAAAPPRVPVPIPSLFGISFKVKCIILLVVSFGLYINTTGNLFALDDGIVIIKNQYVQDGIGGIKKILTTDAYDSYYKEMHASQMLAGGRYRPLSIVVFAIEQSIFNDSSQVKLAIAHHTKPTPSLFVVSDNNYWHIKHFINVLFYMACILSIFYFLSKYLLKKIPRGEDIAFVATMLFAIHPLHTEVIANVKSLDEILSLLLIMCTFIFALKYTQTKKGLDLVWGMLFYFLSLLAKEYAAMMIFLLPLAFYLLVNNKIYKVIMASLPYLGVFVVYMLLRIYSVGIPKNVPGGEILNNPYLLATHSQKIATEWFVMGKYLYMLFFPYPLSSDYSYNTIPYHNFSDLSVLFSILIYMALIAWGVWLILKKNILAFPVFFYLLNLFMVSNFLVDIGATMGERLAFHSSLGFVVLISYGAFYATRKMSSLSRRNLIGAVMAILLVLCATECIPRNAEWKDDITLFTTDVHTVPNSAMVLGNAGARYINLADQSKIPATSAAYLRESINCLLKAISLDKIYVTSYLNLGVAYYKIQEPDSAKMCWDAVKKLYPDYPNLKEYYPLLAEAYLGKGMKIGKQNLQEGIQEMSKGIPYADNNAFFWYNLGGAYFTIKDFSDAKAAWTKVLQINPDYKYTTDKDPHPASLATLFNTIFVKK